MLGSISFGNFTSICQEVSLPICALWTPEITLNCKAGSLAIGSKEIADFGNFLISIIAAILMIVIVYRTHVKYAAVGRREMNILFAFYGVTCILEAINGSGLLTSISISQILSGIQIGFILASAWVLLLNGIVGYQLVEDGGPLSFFGILGSGVVWVAIGTIFSLDASQGLLGANTSPSYYVSPTLYGLYLIFPILAVLAYIILETVLVAKNLGDQKPLTQYQIILMIVNLYAALIFFALAQVLSFALNETICNGTSKSVDGKTFSALCNLCAVIFIYRFWDSITEDDWDNIDDIFV